MTPFRFGLCAALLCAASAGAADDLGKLSAKYESGKAGPTSVSTGNGDPGGVSYGTYQMTTKSGHADLFVQRFYKAEFTGLKTADEAKNPAKPFAAKWKAVAGANPEAFHANEYTYIKETHYDPQAKLIEKELGLVAAKRSAALRDVVWSTAVHHGGKTGVIVTAVRPLLKDAKIDAVTDEAIIRAVYAERGRKNGDKLAHFPGVTEKWIPGLTKRFEDEMKDALEMLKK